MVWRVVLGVGLSWCSTARRIHDETERIVALCTTVTPTSESSARVPVGPLIGYDLAHHMWQFQTFSRFVSRTRWLRVLFAHGRHTDPKDCGARG